ncbi:phosphotransferase family protein [Neobacillus niacini]|uniref:phosphotransferase family protein n=1 Tax=Neobacillus niacini TaxID=86668 RepID=UPI0021CB65C4|nr:aminoglycoside phosphotransferase family protein [Neobacillus niacini]MCM3767641.1 aminoglycoside phosphotransferase family protein [Neobacillus niacini]
MNEKIIKKHLNEKYGDFKLERLTGGYTNETFLLKSESQPPLVIKLAHSLNKDIENEINCLKLMQDTGVTPKIYDVINTDRFQIIVMEYRNGQNGQSILDSKEQERAEELYKRLGASLAKNIHSKIYEEALEIKASDFAELNLDLDFVPEDLIGTSKDILLRINDSQEEWVLTHGDYGVHNVLYTDSNTLTILDWEWAEWANPITDIAWVCWFTKLHFPEYAEVLNPLFMEEYKQHSPIHISPQSLKGYCVYKVWKVLHKVQHAPKEVQQEWIRRLRWTVETDLS